MLCIRSLRFIVAIATFAPLLHHGHCALDLEWGDDSDLSTFVTRPDIKAPLLHVQQHDRSNVSPGFYFTAPYAQIYQQKPPPRAYEACQTGPHIYDKHGSLVWSGACMYKNRNVADFRSTQLANGTFVLSGIQLDLFDDDVDHYGDGKTRGQGHIFDESYRKTAAVKAPANMHSFNMHELKLVNDGQSAMHLLWKPEYLDVTHLGIENRTAGWVGNMGFREVDVASGNTLFEWWSLQNVPLEESTWPTSGISGPVPLAWDYIHLDAVDKTPAGEYLISARHTDCIYKIGRDGTVLWRLGGKTSSFELVDDLKFSRQHDVRSVRAESLGLRSEPTVEYVTLFNNAGDELGEAESTSSALSIRLDLTTMKATTVLKIGSIDMDPTTVSGNSQALSNGNTLVSWGINNYISEHDSHGRLIAEARFASDRFATYRAYKLDWHAHPNETELVLKCTAWGTSPSTATTVCHVSWNGATEVSSWRFSTPAILEPSGRIIGVVAKDGFETKLESYGYSRSVVVEALDPEGLVLGTSGEVTTSRPADWRASRQDVTIENHQTDS